MRTRIHLLWVLLVLTAADAFSQGTVLFLNKIEGVLDAPVVEADGDTRVAGPAYVAQLFYQLNHLSPSVPAGLPVPLKSGAEAGYWDPGSNPVVEILGIEADRFVSLSVQVWDATKGATLAEAISRGGRGNFSNQITVRTGGDGSPPAPLLGLKPINLGSSMSGGTVSFNNRIIGTVDAPVVDIDGTTRLSGGSFSAQLYCGPTKEDLRAAGPTTTFREGKAAGYVNAVSEVSVPGVLTGLIAYVQIRVWEAAYGNSYEEAAESGGKHGLSNIIGVILGGRGPFGPPSTAPDLAGIQPFGLIIETKTIVVPPGFSLISNPFLRGANTVVEVLPNVPEGIILYRFDSVRQIYSVNVFDFGRWTDPDQTLPPGDGAFILNPESAPLPLTFIGAPTRGNRIVERLPGFYLVGCPAPQPCRIEEFITFPPLEGDVVYRFSDGKYLLSQFEFGDWQGFPPVIPIGEAVFLKLVPRPQLR